ncbi:hypothetical protein ACQPXH_10215 [Nocardia sp. CA-135953]|uniref:hypothetical protein n=1 Tax=Nocardia sp. CA-135953 TaxID=3239978 RepID=UPI003D980760
MNEHRRVGYGDLVIQPIDVPDPALVDGWWRATWRFALPDRADVATFEVPAPPADFDGATVVVRLVDSTSEVVVDTFDRRGHELAGDVITYLSLIALGLKERFGAGVAFGGRPDHPLFTVSRRSSGEAD